jgi:prepilin-type N-terminal cleavage/methylation domain-containing protein
MFAVMPKHRFYRGFTLIEMAMVIAVAAALSGVGAMAWTQLSEDGEATAVRSLQATIQNKAVQIADRLEQPANTLNSAAFNNMMAGNLGEATLTWTGGTVNAGRIQVRSGKLVNFTMDASGRVTVISATGWSKYVVNGGQLRPG